jgi:hypothetical protein
MMKIILNLLLLILLVSCKKESYFSDFDTIEYYSLKNDSLIDYKKKEDSLAIKIFNEDFPNELNNIDFYKVLNGQKFSKHTINNDDVSILDAIFKKRFSFSGTASACVPNYRDILILKKKDSIIGVAKICLECEMFHFIGNDEAIETKYFGGNDEYKELNEILKKYK